MCKLFVLALNISLKMARSVRFMQPWFLTIKIILLHIVNGRNRFFKIHITASMRVTLLFLYTLKQTKLLKKNIDVNLHICVKVQNS